MDEPDRDLDTPRVAPEGSACRGHPDREALVECPVCRRNACESCYRHEFGRCITCIATDPAAIAPRIPWEDPARGGLARYFATLTSALSPHRTAPAFAMAHGGRAMRFFLVSFVPLAFLAGVIRYTVLLRFGPLGAIEVAQRATPAALVWDVARGGTLSLADLTVQLVALAACYASLSVAYGGAAARAPALRALLYRAFLLPVGNQGLILALGVWLGPSTNQGFLLLLLALAALPAIPLLVTLRSTARLASRIDAVPSFVVAIVPWALVTIVGMLSAKTVAHLLGLPTS